MLSSQSRNWIDHTLTLVCMFVIKNIVTTVHLSSFSASTLFIWWHEGLPACIKFRTRSPWRILSGERSLTRSHFWKSILVEQKQTKVTAFVAMWHIHSIGESVDWVESILIVFHWCPYCILSLAICICLSVWNCYKLVSYFYSYNGRFLWIHQRIKFDNWSVACINWVSRKKWIWVNRSWSCGHANG